MNIIAPIIYIGWLVLEILLSRFRKSKLKDRSEDRNSLSFLWITIMLSCFTGGMISIFLYMPVVKNDAIHITGLAVILGGMLLRAAAIISLGRYFTVDVAIREDHRVIDKGLYKFTRHPSYTGALLSFLGLALYMNNWLSLAVVMIPVATAFIKRIQIEEAALEKQFGEAYRQYKRHTWRLLPLIY